MAFKKKTFQCKQRANLSYLLFIDLNIDMSDICK